MISTTWCWPYLHNRMPSCGRFDCTPASLGLIVSSVVRLGLHLDVELILVCAMGDRPFQRGERGHRDAGGHEGYRKGQRSWKEIKVMLFRRHTFILCGMCKVLALLLIYLQMLETSGLGQIGDITKKGSAAGLVFMSWLQDTK